MSIIPFNIRYIIIPVLPILLVTSSDNKVMVFWNDQMKVKVKKRE